QGEFTEAFQSDGPEKIGALRVLSRTAGRDSLARDSIANEILQVFTSSTDYRTRLTALETMGKLGLFFPDNEEISQKAEAGEGGNRTMAQSVMANSGTPEEATRLAQFLFSPETLQYRYAAYSLAFLEVVPDPAMESMREKYDSMDD